MEVSYILNSSILFVCSFNRFGTSMRKDRDREDWPAPGTHNLPSYTKGSRTHFSKRDTGKDQILDPRKLAEIRKKLSAKGDGLGPASYPLQKVASGPLFTFGSRFESTLGSKSHLKPKKVDGPGPGAYKLPSSIKV